MPAKPPWRKNRREAKKKSAKRPSPTTPHSRCRKRGIRIRLQACLPIAANRLLESILSAGHNADPLLRCCHGRPDRLFELPPRPRLPPGRCPRRSPWVQASGRPRSSLNRRRSRSRSRLAMTLVALVLQTGACRARWPLPLLPPATRDGPSLALLRCLLTLALLPP